MDTNKLPAGYSHATLVKHPTQGQYACVRLHVAGSNGYLDRAWVPAGTAAQQVKAMNRG